VTWIGPFMICAVFRTVTKVGFTLHSRERTRETDRIFSRSFPLTLEETLDIHTLHFDYYLYNRSGQGNINRFVEDFALCVPFQDFYTTSSASSFFSGRWTWQHSFQWQHTTGETQVGDLRISERCQSIDKASTPPYSSKRFLAKAPRSDIK
jgi:hypothetical protein